MILSSSSSPVTGFVVFFSDCLHLSLFFLFNSVKQTMGADTQNNPAERRFKCLKKKKKHFHSNCRLIFRWFSLVQQFILCEVWLISSISTLLPSLHFLSGSFSRPSKLMVIPPAWSVAVVCESRTEVLWEKHSDFSGRLCILGIWWDFGAKQYSNVMLCHFNILLLCNGPLPTFSLTYIVTS